MIKEEESKLLENKISLLEKEILNLRERITLLEMNRNSYPNYPNYHWYPPICYATGDS